MEALYVTPRPFEFAVCVRAQLSTDGSFMQKGELNPQQNLVISRAMLRRDYRKVQEFRGDRRPPERLCAHFTLEQALAQRLTAARPEHRAGKYTEIYDELFRSLPDHPQHAKRMHPNGRSVIHQIQCISPFLRADATFLEIGCGDAALSFSVAASVGRVIGVDVQENLIDFDKAPRNFQFIEPVGGITFPLPTSSIDLAFSDQLLEHLHPDDALAQLREVVRVLRPGGLYICSTPNAVTGPHDISMYFGYVAAGLHLKEYSYLELGNLLRMAGFKSVSFQLHIRKWRAAPPSLVLLALERMLVRCPRGLRSRMARTRLMERIMGIHAIART